MYFTICKVVFEMGAEWISILIKIIEWCFREQDFSIQEKTKNFPKIYLLDSFYKMKCTFPKRETNRYL